MHREALLARYFRIVNESQHLKLARQPESVIVGISIVGIPRHIARQLAEFQMTVFIKTSRELTGRNVRPTRVAFAHVRNADVREFERSYGCRVEFGAPSDQVEYSNEAFAQLLITEDLNLLDVLRPFCEEAARERHTASHSIRAAVENEVQRLLPRGPAKEETVAKALALGVRTLSRRRNDVRGGCRAREDVVRDHIRTAPSLALDTCAAYSARTPSL